MNELVQKLSVDKHRVEVSLRTERTTAELKKRVDSGYIHLKFVDTKGGTDLGVCLVQRESDLQGADFTNGTGIARLVGTLTLNYVKVRCIAEIDVRNLTGQGWLEPQTE